MTIIRSLRPPLVPAQGRSNPVRPSGPAIPGAGVSERAREAAILKLLGGLHRQILIAYLVENGPVGAIAGSAGVALGATGAWSVVTIVFKAA